MSIDIYPLKLGEVITVDVPYGKEHVRFENLSAKQATVLINLVQISQTCYIRSSAALILKGDIHESNK